MQGLKTRADRRFCCALKGRNHFRTPLGFGFRTGGKQYRYTLIRQNISQCRVNATAAMNKHSFLDKIRYARDTKDSRASDAEVEK